MTTEEFDALYAGNEGGDSVDDRSHMVSGRDSEDGEEDGAGMDEDLRELENFNFI